MVAGTGRARRAAHAGDQARRRRRAGPPLPDAGLRPPPPRRGALERRGDRQPRRDRGRRDELRRRVRSQFRPRSRGARRRRLRSAGRSPDGVGRLRRRSRGKHLRTERPRGRFHVVRGQAALVRSTRALARGDPGPFRAAADRRRLQRGPRGRRRLERGRSPRRHARLGAGARRLPGPPCVGTDGHLAGSQPGPAALHLVGLPRRQLPAQRGDADRPPAGDSRRPRRGVVAVEVDREARKGTPTPSDHAPLVLDLDAPGKAFDAGWGGSEERFAARRAAQRG